MVSILERYLYFAFAYGGLRKIAYTWNTQYKQKVKDKVELRPILYSHRMMHFLLGGISGVWLAPIHICNDIERLEMYVRNIKPFSSATDVNEDIDFYTVLMDMHKKI